MKNKNLSFSLSLYLICSEVFLATIIVIVGYWFTKNLIVEGLLHKLRYHTEEVISPIKTSKEATQFLVDNFTNEFLHERIIQDSEKNVRLVFEIQPGIVALRFVTFEKNNFKNKNTDFLYLRNDSNIINNSEIFYDAFPPSKGWMNTAQLSNSAQWSPVFYSRDSKISAQRILIYSKPTEVENIRGIIYCAISIDKEMKSLNEAEVYKTGFPVLLSQDGNIIYPENTTIKEDDNLNLLLSQLDYQYILDNQKEGTEIVYPELLNKKKSLALYWPLKSLDWVIVAVLPVTTYMSGLYETLFYIVIIILLIGSLSAGFAIYLSRKLVYPITTLADASRKIIEEEGIKSTSLVNEVDILSQSIEIMKRKLRNFEKEKLKTEMDHEEMDRELKLAKEIEMGIVPTKFPLFPGRFDFDCYGKLIPAKIVGGDLFDFFLLDDDHLFISICDTLGKGIPAAMFAVATRTLIRSIANPITRIGKMMELLNDELTLSHESDMYVTVMMGRLDLSNGEFSYCNAGHPRPFILRNDNRIEEFETIHGFPIGVRKKQKYYETFVTLNPGETIFAYTDGITEEVDKHGNFYGKERLYSVIQGHSSFPPEKIIKDVFKNLDKFRGKNEIYDDTTMIGLKYIGKNS